MSTKSDPLSDIQRDFARVSPEIVKKAAGFQAAILADVAGRRGTLNGRIRGLAPSMKFAGPALTVEVRPGDNLMIHAAMALAKPGDVLVVDGKGDQTCALMGAIMMNACKKIGLAGVILDAACRDAEEICQLDFPVFSVGTNPNGPTKFVPGRINWPISAGGIAISPGDLDRRRLGRRRRRRARQGGIAARARSEEGRRRVEAHRRDPTGREPPAGLARRRAARRRRAERGRDAVTKPVDPRHRRRSRAAGDRAPAEVRDRVRRQDAGRGEPRQAVRADAAGGDPRPLREGPGAGDGCEPEPEGHREARRGHRHHRQSGGGARAGSR